MIPRALREGLERALDACPDLDESAARSLALEPAGGGCVNQASRVKIGGDWFFLKTNARQPEGMFRAEALGLRELRKPNAIRVPRPLAVGAPEIQSSEAEADGLALVPSAEAFLLMEYLPPGAPAPDHAERLGRELAALHRTTAERFGLGHDNFIGSTPQENAWTSDWPEFFAVRRIEPQIRLARDKGLADAGMIRQADRLAHKLDDLLGDPAEPPALLHGDLWSGNQHPGPKGAPTIFDPAAYYGRREADLAMTELFGGFPAAFYSAYKNEWPLAEGYEVRREIYDLYHLLNHLNLFGASYAGRVGAILGRHT